MSYLGTRQASGKLNNTGNNPYGNGLWAVTFNPAILAMATNQFEVYHIALTGPAGSTLQVFIDSTFYDTTSNANLNSWDPNQPLVMSGGQSLIFYWNSSATPAPFVTIWCRTPSALL